MSLPPHKSSEDFGRKLAKRHRLTHRSHIRLLFTKGRAINLYPFKVFFIQQDRESFLCNKALFAVPKKKVPSAIRRNKIKRFLKEAYRLHKYILDCSSDISEFVFLVGYVYTGGGERLRYPIVKEVVMKSLNHLHTQPKRQ